MAQRSKTRLAGEKFLLKLNVGELQDACDSNPFYANICADDYFWHRKLIHDFKRDQLKDYDLSYEEKWIACNNRHPVTFYYMMSNVGPIIYKDYITRRGLDDYDPIYMHDPLWDKVMAELLRLRFKDVFSERIDTIDAAVKRIYPDNITTFTFNYKTISRGEHRYITGKCTINFYLSYRQIVDVPDIDLKNVIMDKFSHSFPEMVFEAGKDYNKNALLTADSYEIREFALHWVQVAFDYGSFKNIQEYVFQRDEQDDLMDEMDDW